MSESEVVPPKPRVEFRIEPRGRMDISAAVDNDEIREYLALATPREQERWLDDHIDGWIDTQWPEPEWWECISEVKFVDWPESVDDLPPEIDPNQMTLLEVES